MSGPVVACGALVASIFSVGCWLGWQLLRQNGRLLLRLEQLEKRLDTLEFGEDDQPAGLSVGGEAPEFELTDLAGRTRTRTEFRGKPFLLVFFNPTCGFCREMMPKLAALSGVRRQAQRDSALPATTVPDPNQSAVAAGALHSIDVPSPEAVLPQVLIISTGDAETNRQLFDGHKVTHPVLLQKEQEVASAYKSNGTPSGYLIDAEGKIASGLALGAETLLRLAQGKGEDANPKARAGENGSERTDRFNNRSLARSKINRDGLKAGTPAPDFRLPRLDGRGELSLSELLGQRVLLVFSSPGCEPCNTLAPEIEKFHREHRNVQVVMVSKGEAKVNRSKVNEFGLTFPVVLQQQWEISRRYAMFATPIAYFIDETGIITHDVAVGSEAIPALMAQAVRSS